MIRTDAGLAQWVLLALLVIGAVSVLSLILRRCVSAACYGVGTAVGGIVAILALMAYSTAAFTVVDLWVWCLNAIGLTKVVNVMYPLLIRYFFELFVLAGMSLGVASAYLLGLVKSFEQQPKESADSVQTREGR